MVLLSSSSNNSEYGDSFAVLNACREEYLRNLNFRINRRNAECSHQPFLWGIDEDIDDTEQTTSAVAAYGCSDKAEEALDDSAYGDEKCDPKQESMPVGDVVPPESHPSEVKADCATQTQSMQLVMNRMEQKKPFVSYAIGCQEPPPGLKRTFNVKSDSDIYPSAVRAEARRKQRSQTIDGFVHDISLPNNFRPRCNSAKQTSAQSNFHSLSRAHSSTTRRSSVNSAKQSSFPFPAVIPSYPLPSSGKVGNQRQLQLCDRQSSMQRQSTVNIGASSNNNWVSEYGQKYPTYPSQIYVRSASQAVSRCRPFTCPSNLARPSCSWLKSLLPSAPVLLSSRGGSETSTSVNRCRGNHCDVSSSTTANDRRIPQIQSAR